MRRRTTILLLAIALGGSGAVAGALATGLTAPHTSDDVIDRALALRLQGKFAAAAQVMFDGWKADPARANLLWELGPQTNIVASRELRDSVAAVSARIDSSTARCAAILMGDGIPPRETHELLAATTQKPVAGRCARMLNLFGSSLDSAESFVRAFPTSPRAIEQYSSAVVTTDPSRAVVATRELARGPHHPMLRFLGYLGSGAALHELGRHQEAIRWEREGEQRARAWGPGAAMSFYLSVLNHVTGSQRSRDHQTLTQHAHELNAAAMRELARLDTVVDWLARARIAHALGMAAQAGGRQSDALEHFGRLRDIADSVGDDNAVAAAHARIGRSLVKLGRLDEAERHLRIAGTRATPTGTLTLRREIAHDLLHLYEAKGQYDAAVAAGRDFVRFADMAGTVSTRMMGHHDLAWLYRRRGMLAESEREFGSMIADIDSIDQHEYWAGEYFESVGQLERAREYYLRALPKLREVVQTLGALARIEEAMGQLPSAMRYARMADADTGRWDPEYAPVLPGLLERQNRMQEARERFRAARRLALGMARTQSFAKIALESAQLELRLGNLGDAMALADSAAAFATLLGITELEVRARATSALAGVRAGERRRSLAALDSALRRGDAMRVASLSSQLHLLRAEALRAAGQRAEAMSAYRTAAGWVDSIADRFANDPFRALFRATHSRVSNGAMDLIAANRDRAGWIDEYARWSVARKGGSVTARRPLAPVAASLPVDEALVDYRVGESEVSALVITRGGADLIDLPISAGALRTLAAEFLAPIAPRIGSRIDVAHIGFDTAAAHALYRALIEPLAERIGSRRRLTIVPDDVLHLVPFDALVSATMPVRYAIDDFTIRYTPHVGIQTRRGPSALSLLAVRPAVALAPPGAGREIAAIRGVLGTRLSLADSGRDYRQRLAARAAKATVVHFATHAEVNDANPDLARIAIGGDSSVVEWLFASQIRAWRLTDALVVLSACETGAGRLAGGEGALSLSRAFLQAGAGGTIATLWPIGESTAELMSDFYRALVGGSPPSDALRAARLRLRETHPEPFYWAGFVYTAR